MANTKNKAKDSTTKAATSERKGPGTPYNAQFLTPLQTIDPEKAREIRRKGQEAQAAKYRQRKTIKEILTGILAENAAETLQSAAVLEYAEKHGKTLSNYDAVVIAQVVEAQKGSTRAAEFVRDSVGDKPGEKVDFTGNMSDADRRMLETVCKRLGIDID